ncbi:MULTISPECIES: PQQ-binding-like beta-propeller repeat protein [unclassified Streptomyces]|uniref:serine/threonine-protein kinase n=1 Tax=unclassified Streptomyces TaxID=2593676 RepID=UPI0006F200B9|nr:MULTISPECIES: PQQ-binding-like beta-propeller repeat protein [unclassified Streptomyces]KQX45678.1 serine/threonine protein kinase [Streptomyces sp. Root1304]KRA79623.1 serine/threonine protein kinase [Streptomyces sp. Root66D1]
MPPLRNTGADREAEGPEYAGDYRLQACLGAGGMGVVHLAASASGLRLAVKVVHARYAEDPEFRARFRQEVAAARRVSGAFTAPVVDADPDAVRPWMATLYVPGPTLSDQVKRNGPLAPAELRRLTAGLAEALRDIHRAGVVHRDLKPSNVLLTDTGPKVIDFGISRPVDSDLHTETGKLIGSPPFMAPEQFQRPREVGPAADVFALGSVLVHASTGHGPFDSDSPYIVAYQVVHDEPDLTGVPADLAPLVARCLAKDPAERPTPAQIMSALLPPSYAAEAFIPAQRRRPALPDGRDEASGPTPAWDADTPVRATAPVPPRRRPRPGRTGLGRVRLRPRPTLAVLAALALAGAGLYAALTPPAGGTPEPPARPEEVATAFAGWHTGLQKHGPTAAPACSYGGGALYCAARGIGLARLDPVTGRVLWSRTTPVESDSPKPPLLLADGLVGAATPTGPLRAYATEGGVPGWSADADLPELYRPAGSAVVLSDGRGGTRAVDSRTGKELWRHGLAGFDTPRLGPYDAVAGLTTVSETSADGTRTRVGALSPRTGEVLRQRSLEGDLDPLGLTGDGAVLLTSRYQASLSDTLVLLDPESGSVRRLALPYRIDIRGIAVRGAVVHVLDADGHLVAFDTAAPKGRVLWELETGAGNVSEPVLGPGDRLYFAAQDGRVLAVDTARGALIGQTRPRLTNGRMEYAPLVPAPLVVGDRVFGTAPDGSVFAVDARDPASW